MSLMCRIKWSSNTFTAIYSKHREIIYKVHLPNVQITFQIKNLQKYTNIYIQKLLKGHIKPILVIGDSFCGNVLYCILQDLFITDIRLNQVLKAGNRLSSFTKLK